MTASKSSYFHVDPAYAPVVSEIGLDAESVFTDPRIKVWRSLTDRENATLDYPGGRLHVKRYPASAGSMATHEIAGYQLLRDAQIPAGPIIAHGSLADGRSFIILEDLAGYAPADKLLEQGFAFDQLLNPTADLAAQLHEKNLHHRDLYLCHFMVKPQRDGIDAKLIDMARVSRLDSVLTRRRWIVKDLAQFWYSTQSLPISNDQRDRWLKRYCEKRKILPKQLIGSIQRKAIAIKKHDAKLQKNQPNRNVSIGD